MSSSHIKNLTSYIGKILRLGYENITSYIFITHSKIHLTPEKSHILHNHTSYIGIILYIKLYNRKILDHTLYIKYVQKR